MRGRIVLRFAVVAVAGMMLGACGGTSDKSGTSSKSSDSTAAADHPNQGYIDVTCSGVALNAFRAPDETAIGSTIEAAGMTGVAELQALSDQMLKSPTAAAQGVIADKIDAWCHAHPDLYTPASD